MDTKLENGEQALSPGGVPLWVNGPAAWVQRAMLRLRGQKGMFCYDRAFGGELARLSAKDGSAAWLAAAREALLPEPAMDVTAAVVEGDVCIFTLRTPVGTMPLCWPIKED